MPPSGNQARHVPSPARRAQAAVLVTAAWLAAAWLAAAAAAPPAETRPAGAPATGPEPIDTIPVTPARPAVKPAEAAETIENALAYTDRERTALNDVRDHDGQVDGVALSILLRRAAMFPTGQAAFREADRPNLKNLWRSPADYRGKLIVVEGLYSRQQDWSAGTAPTPYHTGPVHMVLLTETVTGRRRGIMVMLPARPPEKIALGKRLRVAGLFYKAAALPTAAEGGKPAEYAIVVAPHLDAPGPGGGWKIPTPALILLVAVVVLLVVFRFAWKYARRGPAVQSAYRPMRLEDGADQQQPTPAQPAEQDVDEDLIRQVEAFFKGRKQHRPGDE